MLYRSSQCKISVDERDKTSQVIDIFLDVFESQQDVLPRLPRTPLIVMSSFDGVMYIMQKEPVDTSLFASQYSRQMARADGSL